MNKAHRYWILTRLSARIDKERSALRTELLGVMNDVSFLKVDDIMLAKTSKYRESFDKISLTVDMGLDFVNKYTKVTQYFELKPIKLLDTIPSEQAKLARQVKRL